MKQDEIDIFNYIYQKSGEEEAQKYIDKLTPILHKRQRESREKEITEFSQKGWGEAALSSIGSVLTKPLEGISYLGQGIDYLMDGEIDENAPYNAFVYENNAARSAVDKKIKETWGEAGSFMYQLGMGLADFAYTLALSHGLAAGAGALGAPIGSVAKAASNLSLAIMSTEAAAETVLDAKDRGLEDGDAFWLGTIAGATELLTEKVSIDTLLNGIGKGKSKLGYLLKNALTEGSEEMTSDAVNWLADVMISKDKSEWEEILLYYRAMGFSEDVAFMEALKEQGRQMLKDGAAGAITGVAAAGGRLAFGQISEGIQNHRNYRETVQNGRQYYALNQLSQGDLARSLGNMNVEQAYRTMSPEAMMEASGLNPRQAQYLLENTGYSPEGRAARPSVNQVYSMLRSTGLNHQETQALMKSKGYSVEEGLGQEAMREPQNVLKKERGSLDFQGDMAEISDRNRLEKIAESGIINKEIIENGIDVEIDKFTPCLIERSTGKILGTIYNRATSSDIKGLKKNGWLFNWNAASLKGTDIYKLALDGDVDPQGLIAISDDPDNYAIYVNLVESAPHNKGKGGDFEGVGGHLFAIAAKLSVDKGYEGYLFLDAKNMELVSHYENTLGARLIGGAHPYRMVIDESAAKRLIEKYTLKEE